MSSVKKNNCVMIIAGEASGDLHGAKLVKAMRKKNRNLFFCGIGGQALEKEGARIVVNAEELSVVGVTEIFPKLLSILKGISTAKKILKSLQPDLLILIDFPDFNLHIAATAKKLGIPTLYYISPQIWAWRSGRIKKIKKRVDHVAVILPFEADFYKKYDIPVTFVGHPLLDDRQEKTKKDEMKIAEDISVIGLAPGSRDGEVIRHLPVMLETAKVIQKKSKNIKFVISLAPTVKRELLEELINKHKDLQKVKIVSGGIDKFFRKCGFVIAVSGTVTLEAAISGIPMVIIYKISWISYLLARILIRGVKNVGLVNLITKKNIIPEILQGKAYPENIADTVLAMIGDRKKISKLRNDLLNVKDMLGGTGASDRVADIAVKMF